MNTDMEKRNEVFKYYIENNVSVRETAEKFGISNATIRKWANKEKWAEKRKQIKNKAQDNVVNKIAKDMAKVDLDIREEFQNIFFNKCRDLENIAEMKNNIQNLKSEDLTQEIAKSNALSNLIITETKVVDSLVKVFDRLERRYLPKDAETDNDIRISITSGNRVIKFDGFQKSDES